MQYARSRFLLFIVEVSRDADRSVSQRRSLAGSNAEKIAVLDDVPRLARPFARTGSQ